MALSPGKWWLGVPKQKVFDNLRFRKFLLHKAARNPALQRQLVYACSQDILFWVNVFCFIFEPRPGQDKRPPRELPFCTWEFQDAAFYAILSAIEDAEPLVITKSRDMGASWMCLTAMTWLWLFRPSYKFLMLSRKEALVDNKGDMDSLFSKVDFILDRLPGWMMPRGWDERRHRTKLRFENPANGSFMNGDSTTGAAGVGGRATAMFLDEFSRVPDEEARQLLAGTQDTTRCRIFNFTPWPESLCSEELAQDKHKRQLRLHWTQHPEKRRGLYSWDPEAKRLTVLDPAYQYSPGYPFAKDGVFPHGSPWFDAYRKEMANDRMVRLMCEIDFQGSDFSFFDKFMIDKLLRETARPPLVEGDLEFDPDLGQPRSFVRAKGGPVKLWAHLDGRGRLPAGAYGLGADCSTGSGASNSCLSVIDATRGEKVLEFATAHMDPKSFAAKCVALARWLGQQAEEPKFAFELQGPGVAFGKHAVELGYRNFYYRQNEQSLAPSPTDTPGWSATPQNKLALLEEYKSALCNGAVVNRSEEALKECKQFVYEGQSVEHKAAGNSADPTGARSNHGDRVIADALAWKMARALRLGHHEPPAPVARPGTLAWRRLEAERPVEVWA